MTKPQSAISNLKQTTPELARSWVVAWNDGKPILVPSGWIVGYTNDHKATPLEAIEYEMERVRTSMIERMEMVNDLELLVLSSRNLIETYNPKLENDGDE